MQKSKAVIDIIVDKVLWIKDVLISKFLEIKDKIVGFFKGFSIKKLATTILNFLKSMLAKISIPLPKVTINWKEIGIWKAKVNIPIPSFSIEDYKPFAGIAP